MSGEGTAATDRATVPHDLQAGERAALASGAHVHPNAVAAVDLGSNSFHMVVARLSGGEPTVLDRLREPVRLGAGLDDERRITPEAQARALACLERFGQRLAHMRRGSVRAVGTNTLRSARNAREFLAAADAALGHPIEIISGIEEARLIYLGVAHSVPQAGARRLVVDIGGGSTELIIGEGFEPVEMESLYMGCISQSRAYFPNGELTAANWRRAELVARQELEPLRGRFTDLGWDDAVGASGTIRTVQEICRASGWTEGGITPAALKRLKKALLEAGAAAKLSLPGLSVERAPVFAGGVVVLTAVFKALGLAQMGVADGALREGALYDLLGRIRHEDVRARAVAALALRSQVDRRQARRVQETAWQCLAQVAHDWGLTDDAHAQLLSWAAHLHEIGMAIAHSHYHKHGAYVVRNADLWGFSQQEQRVLATLVRAHRRKFPTAQFKDLPAEWVEPARRLAILLRLAVVLHRSRHPAPVPPFSVHATPDALDLRFPEDWLAARPLTRADLEQEAAYLTAAGVTLTFA